VRRYIAVTLNRSWGWKSGEGRLQGGWHWVSAMMIAKQTPISYFFKWYLPFPLRFKLKGEIGMSPIRNVLGRVWLFLLCTIQTAAACPAPERSDQTERSLYFSWFWRSIRQRWVVSVIETSNALLQ
jgi:hypothetical protein